MLEKLAKLAGFCVAATLLAGCAGGGVGLFGGGTGGALFSGERGDDRRAAQRAAQEQALIDDGLMPDPNRETIFDLFTNSDDPNDTVAVNRYLWNASLEILDFMPVEAADIC